jgi:hypothetical protein
MIRTTRVWLFALATLALTAGAFAQGFYYESVTKGGPLGDQGRTSKTYAMPKMFKHVDQGGEIMVARLDQEKFYGINTSEKSYWEMTFAEMEAMVKQLSAKGDKRMAEMEEKMKGLSPEQRKMMEQMMPGGLGKKAGGPVEVTKSGESRSISGQACAKYVATSDGKELVTVWTTRGLKGFDAMRKDWEQFAKRMMAMSPGAGKLAEAMTKIEGFPMETTLGGMGIVTTVTKVEPRSTPAGEFAVPAGYTKKAPPMQGGEKGGE